MYMYVYLHTFILNELLLTASTTGTNINRKSQSLQFASHPLAQLVTFVN